MCSVLCYIRSYKRALFFQQIPKKGKQYLKMEASVCRLYHSNQDGPTCIFVPFTF